jgi:hypothetical protein
MTGGPTGGTFTLLVNGEETSPIAFDASDGTIDAALEAIVGSGGSTVVGPLPTLTISFVDGAVLTVGTKALTGGAHPDVVVERI